jgi:CheY-like chemotaxis protein
VPEKRRILVVDDDRDIVRGLSIRLRAAGYLVETAFDGPSGLAAATEELPDALVLDIRLPGLDGLSVLSRLRSQPETRTLPVVVVSANIVEQTRARALELGVRYFLSKPYQAAALIEMIAAVLAESSTVGESTGPCSHEGTGPPARPAGQTR